MNLTVPPPYNYAQKSIASGGDESSPLLLEEIKRVIKDPVERQNMVNTIN